MKESEVVKIIENYIGYADRSRTEQCLHEVNFNLVAKDITKKLREVLIDYSNFLNCEYDRFGIDEGDVDDFIYNR